jgi:hypothetical protein
VRGRAISASVVLSDFEWLAGRKQIDGVLLRRLWRGTCTPQSYFASSLPPPAIHTISSHDMSSVNVEIWVFSHLELSRSSVHSHRWHNATAFGPCEPIDLSETISHKPGLVDYSSHTKC